MGTRPVGAVAVGRPPTGSSASFGFSSVWICGGGTGIGPSEGTSFFTGGCAVEAMGGGSGNAAWALVLLGGGGGAGGIRAGRGVSWEAGGAGGASSLGRGTEGVCT